MDKNLISTISVGGPNPVPQDKFPRCERCGQPSTILAHIRGKKIDYKDKVGFCSWECLEAYWPDTIH